MDAPSTYDLLKDEIVKRSLEQAWMDSCPADPIQRHEEGGWIYTETSTGAVLIRRALAGTRSTLDLSTPPMVFGAMIVATFHTHPNPTAEGWEGGPSPADTHSAHLFGVPCIIRADDGVHTTGPKSRRGGLTGSPRYPE